MMRPPLLERYVVKEFLSPFCVGLLVFTFLLVLNHVFRMMDMFLNRGVESWTIIKMTFLVLPMFLPMSVPMACLLATLLCYGRFTEDGELTAFRSGGLPLSSYGMPSVWMGLLFSLILVFFNLFVAPLATREFKNMHYIVAQKNPMALFATGVMNHFGEYKIIVEKMDRRKKKLMGVSIYKMNPDGAPTRILAPEGEITTDAQSDITIQLNNGAVHQPSQNKDSQYTITKFNKFALRIPAKLEMQPRVLSPREMSLKELQDKIKQVLRENGNPAPLRTEKNMRIAVAFSPVAFTILGVAFGVQFRKGAKSMGIGMSLVILLVYYGLSIFFISLASQGVFSSLFLTWCPNLIALGGGGFLWKWLAQH